MKSHNSDSNPYIEWLCCLYLLNMRIRREGIFSIEEDLLDPWNPISAFRRFPAVMTEPGLSFATDILRMMVDCVGHVHPDIFQFAAETAIKGYCAADQGNSCESLLLTIWLPMWGTVRGFGPLQSCHIGRHAIPAAFKPSYEEMEKILRALERKSPGNDGSAKTRDELDADIEDFIASLNKSQVPGAVHFLNQNELVKYHLTVSESRQKPQMH